MKIAKMSATNILRLSAVEIEPSGDIVTLGGKNGAGKTSVLNAIHMALAGKRHMPPQPIHKGEERASVTLDLGELIVERVITEKSDRLIVRNADGSRHDKPQSILDKLFSSVSFDPLKFIDMDSKAQVALLQELAGVDLAPLDAQEATLAEQRRDCGVELKSAMARLAHSPPRHEDVPMEMVGLDILRRRLESAIAENANNEARARERLRLAVSVEKLEGALAAEYESLRILDRQIAGQGYPDVDALRRQLQAGETDHANLLDNARHNELAAEVAALKKQHAEYQDGITAVRVERKRMCAEATYPVAGLAFDETGVKFDGLPIMQASRAEQIRISVAIGAALHPTLRVLLIRDGSLLDDDGLQLLANLAEEQDVQIWLEDARTKDPAAVIIEDGEVLNARQSEPGETR